jgi:hypothetical protein
MELELLCEKYKEMVNGSYWPDMNDSHSYGPVYEEILKPYKDAQNILEIGLFTGARLRVWESYFKGKVYGVDCSETPLDGTADLRPMIAEGTHNIFILDATNKGQIENAFNGILFDVIIDDGSHLLDHQLTSYSIFKNHLSKGGIYIIEDIQDIDANRKTLEEIDPERSVEIIDLREKKGRYDDVLVIIK